MQITVTGRHFEITAPLREHIESKINKLTRYLEGITDANVVLSVEKHRHIAEFTLQVNGKSPIRAVEEMHDMYLAVDTALEKIERQVRKKKDKGTDRKGRTNIIKEGAEIIEDEEISADVLEQQPKVIRSQKIAVKPMSVDEAAMQMGLSNNEFLAFLNSETEQMNVMYRRRDGNYGLIEPEF